jgi:hypothetical protein
VTVLKNTGLRSVVTAATSHQGSGHFLPRSTDRHCSSHSPGTRKIHPSSNTFDFNGLVDRHIVPISCSPCSLRRKHHCHLPYSVSSNKPPATARLASSIHHNHNDLAHKVFAMSPNSDNATARFLFAILRQKNLKDVCAFFRRNGEVVTNCDRSIGLRSPTIPF